MFFLVLRTLLQLYHLGKIVFTVYPVSTFDPCLSSNENLICALMCPIQLTLITKTRGDLINQS